MSQLNLIRIDNPLNPTVHTRESMMFTDGKSLGELFPTVLGTVAPLAYTINGRVIESHELASTFPADGDFVTVCPIPEGGDGGGAKNVIRVVAMIVISIYAPPLAGFLTFEGAAAGILTTGAQIAAANAALTVGFTVAGAMLVNSLLAPPKPKRDKDTSSYGIDGAKNTSAEGVVVPVCYGTFRMAGNILSNYVVNDDKTQILYMLICAGEGEVAGLTDIQLNDQPITSFKEHEEVLDRTGKPDQLPIPWFADSIVPISVGQEIGTAYKYVTIGTPGTDVYDRLRVDLSAPGGLFWANAGNSGPVTLTIEIDYRPAGTPGDTGWMPLPMTDTVSGYTSGNSYVTGYSPTGAEYIENDVIYIDVVGESTIKQVVGHVTQTPVYSSVGSITVKGSKRDAVRRSIMTGALTQGAYQLRYRRLEALNTDPTVTDIIYLTDVNKIIDEDVAYRNTALVALKVRLTDQLNGMPNVTYLNHGKLVKVWNQTTKQFDLKSSSNPAWITYDILTNKRYGGGCSESRIDLDKWIDWASWCQSQGLEFNGIFDTQKNVWDAASEVARCGHAQVMMVGTRYTVVIERAESPVMMFSVANMISGTFKENWTGMSDRANEIEVTYSDKEDNYRQRTIRLYNQLAFAAGQPQRVASIDGMGIVTSDRAFKEAQLQLNLNHWVQRTVEFGAFTDAIACTPGDVVLVQHDMPQWGVGGRLESGNTTSVIKLDRPVLMEGGKTYQALVHVDDVVRLTTTVHSVVGTDILLNGYSGATNVRRIIIGTKDLEILNIVQSGAYWGVTVSSTTGISPGQTAVLHDTNALLTRNVVNPLSTGQVQTYTQLTLATALDVTPNQFDKWLFGQTNKVNKPFRVVSISGSHEYRRDIKAIEYYPDVYSGSVAGPAPNYSALDPRLVQNVVVDGVRETGSLVGSSSGLYVFIDYHSTQQTYKEADVYVSRNGGVYQIEGTHPRSVSVFASKGDVLDFRVVARDVHGNTSGFVNSEVISYTVTGISTAPPDVTGLTIEATDVGLVVTWVSWNTPWAGDTEIRVGSDWATGATLFRGKSNTYTAVAPPPGAYTIWVKHHTVDGTQESVTPVTSTIVWDGFALTGILTLTTNSQIFKVSSDGTTTTPASITITANGQGFAGSPVFTVTAGTLTGTLTGVITGSGNSRTILPANMTSDELTVSVSWGGQIDMISLHRLRDGSSAISASLQNQYQGVLCDAAGTPLPGTTPLLSQMTVMKGATTLTSGVTYSCTTATGFTGTFATYINSSTGAISIPSISAASASATFRADLGGGVTIERTLLANKVRNGEHAIQMSLSNGAHTLPAASDGTVTSYVGSGTEVRVFEGVTELDYDGIGAANGTWTLSRAVQTGILSTLGTITESVKRAVVGDHGGLTTDVATVRYTVTGKTSTGGAISLFMDQTLTKAKAGSTSTIVTLFRRTTTNSAPSVDTTGSATYTFGSGFISGQPLNWTIADPGSSSGAYLWSIQQSCSGASGTATLSNASWSAPVLVGVDVTNTAKVQLFRWAPISPTPAKPTGTSTWTWASSAQTGYAGAGGWSMTIPSNPGISGQYLWVATKLITALSTAVSTSVDWSADPSSITVDAVSSNGLNGIDGIKTTTVTVYRWETGAGAPTGPSGSPLYTWATNSFGAAPTNWQLTPGTAPAPGYTLWGASVFLSDAASNAQTSFDWVNASITARGYAGTNGSPGVAGASARRAYSRIVGNPTPTGATFNVAGDALPTQTQSNNNWALNVAWSAADPLPSSTNTLYQADGTYNPATNQTTWSTPYISSLKVGTLSAVAVNTGNLTANGNITVTGDIFSNNFVAGSTGWRIRGDGSAELSNAVVRGSLKVNTAEVSGSTMTGTGAKFNTDGTFALGNGTTNISFNGSTLTLNGSVVATGNVQTNAISDFFSATSLTTTTGNVAVPVVGTPAAGVALFATFGLEQRRRRDWIYNYNEQGNPVGGAWGAWSNYTKPASGYATIDGSNTATYPGSPMWTFTNVSVATHTVSTTRVAGSTVTVIDQYQDEFVDWVSTSVSLAVIVHKR
jgi:predicted phage tail protein